MEEITATQKKFLKKYAETLDIKQSAIFGGYGEKIAKAQGEKLLKKEKYINALNSIIDEKAGYLDVSKGYIVNKYLLLINWASRSQNACNKRNLGEVKKTGVYKKGLKNESVENALCEEFFEPNDPAILLRALEGLTRFLERGKNSAENEGGSPFSQILGLNCEKI